MPTIRRVDIVGNDMLDIQLSNGNIIILELAPLLLEPRFAHLLKNEAFLYPKTDGQCVYWANGPRLSVEEILALLRRTR